MNSVKPFIRRVKLRNGNIQDPQLPHRSMAATGLDQHRTQRTHSMPFPVQLHFPAPFQHNIDFGHPFVVMHLCLLADLHHMHTRRGLTHAHKTALRRPTGARLCRDLVQLLDLESFHFKWLNGGLNVAVQTARKRAAWIDTASSPEKSKSYEK